MWIFTKLGSQNIFVGEVYFFSQEEIKLFVSCRLVVRVWCQHYDNSKAQLIQETEAGAWWWLAAGSNMSGQAGSADLSGQKHWQLYVFNVCLMEVGTVLTVFTAQTDCHFTLPLSTQLNTQRRLYLPPETRYPGQQAVSHYHLDQFWIT